MTEALGVAAGAFGIVSLSIQLAESVQKVKCFYEKVKNAPPELADLIEEIEEMSDLVKDLEHENQSTGFVVSSSMQKCIKSSRKAVEYFEKFAVALQNRTTKSRMRGGLKFALSQDDIRSMLNRLERSKSLLTLAYIQYQQAINQQQQDATRKIIEGLASGQGVILKAVQTAGASGGDGVTTISKRHFRQGCGRAKRIFGIKTPKWMSKHIWQLALDRSTSGWQFTLKTYGIVSSDSQVFKACEAGDILGMRKLFDAGLASPFDCNEDGDNLWTTSLQNHNTDVIRFLLGCGASSVDGMQPSAMFWLFAFAKTSTSDLHEGTLFLYENCDEERPRNFIEMDALQFASCPLERRSSFIFWQRIKYWYFAAWEETWKISDFASHSDLFTQYEPANFWGMSQLQLLAYNLGYRVAFTEMDMSDRNAKELGEFISAAIDSGLDVHESSNGHTPLTRYLSAFRPNGQHQTRHGFQCRMTIKKSLLIWLDLLQRAGVDLFAYGKEEMRLSEGSQSLAAPALFSEQCAPLFPDKEDTRLHLTLSYGSTPSEWDVELLHQVEQYAEEFWRMVDKQTEEDERRRHATPGGWVHDGRGGNGG